MSAAQLWHRAAALLFVAACTQGAFAQGPAAALQAWHVQGRVYLIAGAGANIAVQVGDAAVEVVNAGSAGSTPQVLAAIRELSDKPLQFIMLTSADADVVSGSLELAQAGHFNSGQPGEPAGAAVVAQLGTLTRLAAENRPGVRLPTDAFETDWAFFNDEPVVLKQVRAAHSDGDSYVFFRRSDVIATGALFEPGRYPVIDGAHGGTVSGVIDALNELIGIMVPRENEEGGTYLIPGRGRICDRTDIVNYRDALTIIRARVAHYASRGMSLEKILAARPTADYDGIYGAEQGDWTTTMFIRAVYDDVRAAGSRKRAGT
jgi:cyclase